MNTESDVPFPFPKNEPIYISKKIKDEEIILNCIPIAAPIKKNIITNSCLPIPIPKYEPTYAI